MASPDKFLRFATLCLLYFVQGAPYGFQSACLPLLLRESGLSYFAIGAMKLLFLPWVCKPLYAPFIETTRTKRFWLTASMSALAATCLAAAALSSPDDLAGLAALLLALNLFSASQDVATDSLAVRILDNDELGAGNTVQVVAYKSGSVFAGGVLLLVRDSYGWGAMFNAFAGMYVIAVILLSKISIVETADEGKKSSSNDMRLSFRDIIRSVFAVPGTWGVVVFVLVYKLCERAEQTFSLFQVDKGVPRATMALWSTVARTASLLGSTYGGYVLYRRGARGLVLKFCWLRTVTIAAQGLIVLVWGRERCSAESFSTYLSPDSALMYLGFAATSATLFSAGVVTTATFTVMMTVSKSAAAPALPDSAAGDLAGTHYTVLATAEILGKLAFAGAAGALTDYLGLEAMYAAFVILAAVCAPLALKTLPVPLKTEQKRLKE